MNKYEALDTFWNGFNIPAYDVNTLPDDVEMPYILYEVGVGGLNDDIPLSASLWYFSTSWRDITLKSEEINRYIGLGGVSQPYDGGVIWIRRGFPFAQRMSEPGNNAVRRIVLNVTVEFQSDD